MDDLNVPTWAKAIPVALSTTAGLTAAFLQSTILVIIGIPAGLVLGCGILYVMSKYNSC